MRDAKSRPQAEELRHRCVRTTGKHGGGSSLKRTNLHFEFAVAQGQNDEFS